MSSNFIHVHPLYPSIVHAPDVSLLCVLFKLLTDSLQVSSILVLYLSTTLKELLKFGDKRKLRLHPKLERGELIQHLPTDVCTGGREGGKGKQITLKPIVISRSIDPLAKRSRAAIPH